MWVWDARVIVGSETCKSLLQFCRSHRINALYLSAYNLRVPMDAVYRQFNREAHRQGLTVHALAGDPRWGQSRYHAVSLEWLSAVQRFNAGSSPDERFDGIHSDVEVYLLAKSWAERPAELLGGYLDLNAEMAEQIHSSSEPLFFSVDIPFWFDDDTAYRILWHGQIKLPSYHVLDTVDAVTVMAYRNFAEGRDGTIELVSLEMEYADPLGKKVTIGQETQRNLFPPYVTFGGTSCSTMRRELQKIQNVLGARPSFGGFAFHHYESYRELCSD